MLNGTWPLIKIHQSSNFSISPKLSPSKISRYTLIHNTMNLQSLLLTTITITITSMYLYIGGSNDVIDFWSNPGIVQKIIKILLNVTMNRLHALSSSNGGYHKLSSDHCLT